MRITSRATYILPFLLLTIYAFFLNLNFNISIGFDLLPHRIADEIYFWIILYFFIRLVLLVAALYFLFRLLAGTLPNRIATGIVFLLPAVVYSVSMLFKNEPLWEALGYAALEMVLQGALLTYTFWLFRNRYSAVLTAENLALKNGLGQRFSIPLAALTEIQSRRNLLSFFREFGFLNWSQKISLSYSEDEEPDYSIPLFLRIGKKSFVFQSILAAARHCGNNAVRLYD